MSQGAGSSRHSHKPALKKGKPSEGRHSTSSNSRDSNRKASIAQTVHVQDTSSQRGPRELFEGDWELNRVLDRQEKIIKTLEKGFEDYTTLLYQSKLVESHGNRIKVYVAKKQCVFDSKCHSIGLKDLPILEGRPKTELERLDVFFLILKALDKHFVDKHKNPSEFEKEAMNKIIEKLHNVIARRIVLRGYKTREDEEEEARLQKISRRTQGYSEILRSGIASGGSD